MEVFTAPSENEDAYQGSHDEQHLDTCGCKNGPNHLSAQPSNTTYSAYLSYVKWRAGESDSATCGFV
jgi:hypothetical protein